MPINYYKEIFRNGVLIMDIGSAQAKQKFNYEGIKEVKVPLAQAVEATKKDGLNEAFFTAGDKLYVAYGKKMDVCAIIVDFANSKTDFKGKEINLVDVDTEVDLNTPKIGDTAENGAGIGMLIGSVGTAILGILSGGEMGLGAVVVGTAVGAGVGYGVGAGVGAIKGAMVRNPDYSKLNLITK